MKSLALKFLVAFFLFGFQAEAQILKKIKKKAEKAAENVLLKKTEEKTGQVVENAFDSITNVPTNDKSKQSGISGASTEANSAKNINTGVKRSFYTSDLIITTSENGNPGSSTFFDADELAMRGESPEGKEIFTDSEGYMYSFNDRNKRWEKTGLMRSDAMSMVMPMTSLSIIKLPAGPMLDAIENFKEKGLNLNTFQLVEWAFVYKPEHFRVNGYTESSVKCGNANCIKFTYTLENKGSYVLFDEQERLKQVYALAEDQEGQIREGIFNFSYAPVSVQIPAAVELKMPLQDLLMPGLNSSLPGNTKPAAVTGQDAISPGEQNSEKAGGDPNSQIATIDPNNPLSFPGITAVLKAGKRTMTMKLDTKNFVMEIDPGEKRAQPIKIDRFQHIYMDTGDECIQAKFDLNRAFGQITTAMEGKALPADINMAQIKADYYKTYFGMDLSPNLFPIAEWAYIYKPEIFEGQDQFQKSKLSCRGGDCTKFTMQGAGAKSNHVLFDQYGRLAEIHSVEDGGGSITYTYEPHNLSTPTGCQYFDMNDKFMDKIFSGMK
jgi:hypothetical protein